MSLDAVISGLERQLTEEDALLELARAWVKRTNGIVIPGEVIDANEYIRRLSNSPLAPIALSEPHKYAALLRSPTISARNQEDTKIARLLLYFPTLDSILEHFLRDPDYSRGDKHNAFGTPVKLKTILGNYDPRHNNGVGGFRNSKGPGNKIYASIKRGDLSEEEVANSSSFREELGIYQSKNGIPKSYKRCVRKVLESFLQDPDYRLDVESGLGRPITLLSVLRDYIPAYGNGQGGFKTNKGEAHRVYQALKKGLLAPDELLKSAGKFYSWNKYFTSNGVPKQYRELASSVISHFLQNPDYWCGKKGRYGLPKNLMTILRDYDISLDGGKGGFLASKGTAIRIYSAIYLGRISEEGLLNSTRLDGAWHDYLNNDGMPRRHRESARNALIDFFKQPLYRERTGNIDAQAAGKPRFLRSILRDYVIGGRWSLNNGTAHNVFYAMYSFDVEDNHILDCIGLTQVWCDYQQSSADNPFVFDPEKYGLDRNEVYAEDKRVAIS